MKTTSKGFVLPIAIAVIAALAIGGTVYVQNKNKIAVQTEADADMHAGMDHGIYGSGQFSEGSTGSAASVNGSASIDAGITIGSATNSPAQQPKPSVPAANVSGQQQVSVQGEYLCLPKKNAGGIQTMECALGLKADNGAYYALDLTGLAGKDAILSFATGTRIKVSGTLVPVEALSSNVWQTYNIKGIIRASTAAKI
ncbi:MAG TPA: hypothetical protein VGE62_00890 [Candidatus Paceibacterota bacterium]